VGVEGGEKRQDVVHGTAIELVGCSSPVSRVDVLDEVLLCAHLCPFTTALASAVVASAKLCRLAVSIWCIRTRRRYAGLPAGRMQTEKVCTRSCETLARRVIRDD